MYLEEHRIFDAIIVGAGAAGCVLAARLSEAEKKQVLLIEAGPDMSPGNEHPDILDPYAGVATGNSDFLWRGLVAESGPDQGDGKARASGFFAQGFGVGGSANINGMGVDRGQPDDYDAWAAMGADDWSWNDVLPYFRKLESDELASLDSDDVHGSNGPMPVRRIRREEWGPFATALCDVLAAHGMKSLDDYTANFRDGFASAPTNALPDRRVSPAMAYLNSAVRARPNLTILPNALVERVVTAAGVATGVELRLKNRQQRIHGREVIIASGAIQSPCLLMRSGIGDTTELARFNIAAVRNLPAVGKNLLNHPVVTIPAFLAPEAKQQSRNRSLLQNWVRYTSHQPGCARGDMHLMFFNKCAWHSLGDRVGAVAVTVLEAFSAGCVTLTSADSRVAPLVKFALLSDRRDEGRLMAGTRLALQLLSSPEIACLRHEAFLPSSRLIAGLSKRSIWNSAIAWLMVRLLDIAPLRRRLLRPLAIDIDRLTTDNAALRAFVMQLAHPQYHACGTCRMGRADDTNTVVDGVGRVHGVARLRVADASIFPTVPRGYPHFIVLMAAEKIADHVKRSWDCCTDGAM